MSIEIFSYICRRYNEVTFMTTQEISQIIADYFKTQPVLKAWLFGAFSRGEQTDRSDYLTCSSIFMISTNILYNSNQYCKNQTMIIIPGVVEGTRCLPPNNKVKRLADYIIYPKNKTNEI